VQRGLHVANRRGEFAGYVAETPHGLFVAFDARSTDVGGFSSLREAKNAVSAGADAYRVGRERGMPLAAVFAMVTGAPAAR
jgi:hypothetical protein